MSDQAQSNNQQMIVYALIAIAVLLAAIVGFMIYNNANNNSNAGDNTSAASSTAGANAANVAAQMPAASAPVAFDTKTATKVPAGMTPEVALKTYMEDIKSGKFNEAYALLPVAQKSSYGSADAYAAQVKQYGITGYQLGTATTSGNDVTIVSQQDTPAMNITYTWVFTKDGGQWYVKSRTMGGTLQ